MPGYIVKMLGIRRAPKAKMKLSRVRKAFLLLPYHSVRRLSDNAYTYMKALIVRCKSRPLVAINLNASFPPSRWSKKDQWLNGNFASTSWQPRSDRPRDRQGCTRIDTTRRRWTSRRATGWSSWFTETLDPFRPSVRKIRAPWFAASNSAASGLFHFDGKTLYHKWTWNETAITEIEFYPSITVESFWSTSLGFTPVVNTFFISLINFEI